MTKKFAKVLLVVFGLFGLTNSLSAADLTSHKGNVATTISAENWTGVYTGINFGGVWGGNNSLNNKYIPYQTQWSLPWTILDPPYNTITSNQTFFRMSGPSTAPRGVNGGGQLGYNYQLSSDFVIGIETDFQGVGLGSGNSNAVLTGYWSHAGWLAPWALEMPLTPGEVDISWYGTIRGRIGYLIKPDLLAYGSGGLAYGDVSFLDQSHLRSGWSLSAGLEWFYQKNWSLKLEYQFVNLTSVGISSAGKPTFYNTQPEIYNAIAGGPWLGYQSIYHSLPQVDVVRAGINYHFNSGDNGLVQVSGFNRGSFDTFSDHGSSRDNELSLVSLMPLTWKCNGNCGLSVMGGPSIETPLGHMVGLRGFTAPYNYQLGNANFVAGAFSRRILRIANVIDIEPEVGVGKRMGIAHETEAWGAIYARWTAFPWNDYIKTKIGICTGLNYATSVPFYELQKSGYSVGYDWSYGTNNGSRLLHYLSPEIAVSAPGREDIEGFVRVHHRSGGKTIFGPVAMFNGADGGVQFLTFGARFRY